MFCHPNEAVIKDSSNEKKTAAKYCAELKMAEAVPRAAVGNQLATNFAFAGKAGASAMPIAKRNTNNAMTAALALPARPIELCSKVKSDHKKMLAAYMRRAPKRSSSQPAGSCDNT